MCGPKTLVYPFEQLKIKVSSVHMAHERITKPNEFFETLTKTVAITKKLRCENIVIHPSNAKLEDIKGFIEQKINPLLEKEEIYICWETFAGKRRFLRQHLPVFTDEGSLDFKIILRVLKQEEFKGDLILEYLPEFHRKLIKDCLKVKKMLENSQ